MAEICRMYLKCFSEVVEWEEEIRSNNKDKEKVEEMVDILLSLDDLYYLI